jgi:hypothetical protein
VQGRLPGRLQPLLPSLGCLILAAAYAAISVSMLTGEHSETLLLGLLALGGLGLGTTFSSILVHLTTVTRIPSVALIRCPSTSGSVIATIRNGIRCG